MNTTFELVPFHEDAAVAVALGTLLIQRGSVDPTPLAEIAREFDIDPDQLTVAAIKLGVEDEILDDVAVPEGEQISQRSPPEFLASKGSVTREYGGLRDPGPGESTTRTNEMSFQSWLLVEATKSARETVNQLLSDHFGDEAAVVRAGTQAAIGTAAFPERILWVAVSYPIDKTDPKTVPAVPNPPSFPFDRLGEILPQTLNVPVEHGGETFLVRNIPVVPFREPREY
ncbi:hypothetical protein C453_05549 [Haloferax elongans ATCC BAA-1513]|uniref:Uncharacterized protein n=1 Tax=Haloferax elongans ATCC BAA-1513 TaxID=1230453 RepID=M0HSA9_HALEO|nr:hypothetical protein [Haloferax elongans]ELZ86577.1 hypothetical protein C453_05549 [Haloferax elongans ATCC BAA-1513]